MKKFLIVYHSEDNDGVCSAAIILNYLINNLKIDRKNIDLLGSTYNSLNKLQENDVVTEKWPKEYDHIIMTDISFNDWKIMKWLYNTFANKFTWIDHHAPIIKLSKEHNFDDIEGLRNISNSAIYNAYVYLYDPFKLEKIPYVVWMLSAWDNWNYEREGINQEFCRAFNKGFTIESKLSVNWYLNNISLILDNKLNGDFINAIVESNEISDLQSQIINIYNKGKEACEREDEDNKELIRINGDKSWNVNGIPAIMVSTTGSTNSLMFKSLQVKDPSINDLRIAIVAKHCSDGNWTISMYNIYDFKGVRENPLYFHCGEYLQKKYNGGGHEGAAGCTLTVNKFCKILKSKQL